MELRDFHIKFSIEPAKEMLTVLHNIRMGRSWERRALKLLKSKGYRYMMFSRNFSKQDLMETMKSLSEGHEPADQRLKWLHKELSDYLDHLDELSVFLVNLENNPREIIIEALQKAKRYLPVSAEIEADLYLVIGGSDGYGVNLLDTRAIVINVGLFVSEMEEMVAMLAHELHHKANNRSREIYWRLQRSRPMYLGRVYSVISELIGEGVATLAMFPFGFAPKYFATVKEIDGDYKKIEDGIQQMVEDISDEKVNEIFGSLYDNVGPLYMVGCDMAKNIEEALGRKTLIAATQEPLFFFQTYDKAVARLGEGYKFSHNTIGILQNLQEKIIHM